MRPFVGNHLIGLLLTIWQLSALPQIEGSKIDKKICLATLTQF